MPPAFVLSQDQTLHKNYFNNQSCYKLFKRIDLARFLCVIWTTFKFNVNCQVTSHYSIFKQLSAIKLIIYQPRRFAYRIAAWYLIYHKFEICQILFSTFFKLFLFQPCRSVSCWTNRGMRFNISQFGLLSNLISNFFSIFLSTIIKRILSAFGDVLFNLPQKSVLSNLKSNFFLIFLVNYHLVSLSSSGDRALNYHRMLKKQI